MAIHNRGLEVALKTLHHAWVNNAHQRPDGIWTVHDLSVGLHVLHDRSHSHNDVLRIWRQFLDGKVHHLAQTCIFVLEQLCRTKE